MEFLKFRGDDDFYMLINSYEKFFNLLVNKGYLRKPPLRCSNCRKFNVFDLKSQTIHTTKPITEKNSYERNGIDYKFFYRCKQ